MHTMAKTHQLHDNMYIVINLDSPIMINHIVINPGYAVINMVKNRDW